MGCGGGCGKGRLPSVRRPGSTNTGSGTIVVRSSTLDSNGKPPSTPAPRAPGGAVRLKA